VKGREFEVPPGVVTVTATVVPIVPGGAAKVTDVAVDEVGTIVPAPKWTAEALARFVPEMVMVPPADGPGLGLRVVMTGVGGGGGGYWKFTEFEVPAGVVTRTACPLKSPGGATAVIEPSLLKV